VRFRWTGGIASLLLLSAITISFLTARPDRVESRQAPSDAPLPSWPWRPGGILYQRPKFDALVYAVVQERDPSVPKGQSLLLQPGQPGFVYGVAGSQRTVAVPKTERIALGTASVHHLSIHGQVYAYDRVVMMTTTAYNGSYAMNGPAGAVAAWNGEPLKPGDVAVDPSVIPLGSYLYVDGYGLARAVDTGSDIVGDHVDLFFEEPSSEISAYGIQSKKVYVLGPISPVPLVAGPTSDPSL